MMATSRWGRAAAGLAAAVALAASGPSAAQQAEAASHVLNVQGADIRAFIQDVSKITGFAFLVDPRVTGTVTVTTTGSLSRTEVFEIFVSTLRANGLIAVPAGVGRYRIAPEQTAAQQPTGTGRDRFTTQIFRLRNIDAASAADTIKPLVGPQGQVLPNRRSNTLVVADYADNLGRVASLVSQIDRDETAVETLSLKDSSALEIANVLRQLSAGPGGEAGATVSIIPVASSNSVLLRGHPDAVSFLSSVARDLDARASEAGDVRVVYLKHADAERLVPVLQQIVGQRQDAETPTTTGAAGGESPSGAGRAAIARYPGANALVISADAKTQRTLADVIARLDVRRAQVLVEAIIVEVSDTAAKELGVQFLAAGSGSSSVPFAVSSFSNSSPNILALASAALGESALPEDSQALAALREVAIQSLLASNGVVAGGGGTINDEVLFGLVLNAVKRDVESNLLSTPSILTLDNEEATILVGQEVPITTGEALGSNNTNPFRTIQRQNVGVQLEVRPQINADGAITLFLRQEVSSISGPVSAAFSELILNKREIETTVLVEDGEIIVLGGLLDQNERLSTERIPLLGDIPGVGALFRSDGRQNVKTNLMVFIRPTIVRDGEAAAAMTGPRLGFIRQEQSQNANAVFEEILREYMPAPPPADPVDPQ